jgi:hypothetical protein
MSTELISLAEMRSYFPDANVLWERVAGLPKSMVAVKAPAFAGGGDALP